MYTLLLDQKSFHLIQTIILYIYNVCRVGLGLCEIYSLTKKVPK